LEFPKKQRIHLEKWTKRLSWKTVPTKAKITSLLRMEQNAFLKPIKFPSSLTAK
jgi:hypothetical protein